MVHTVHHYIQIFDGIFLNGKFWNIVPLYLFLEYLARGLGKWSGRFLSALIVSLFFVAFFVLVIFLCSQISNTQIPNHTTTWPRTRCHIIPKDIARVFRPCQHQPPAHQQQPASCSSIINPTCCWWWILAALHHCWLLLLFIVDTIAITTDPSSTITYIRLSTCHM